MPETRRIENYGILKLLPTERGANNLIVLCDVIQLPFSEYSNLKSNPTKSHYGYVCFMSGEYVLDVKDIQFRRQIIVDRDRYIIQLAWQEYCNSKTIAQELGAPAPDTPVEYPIWLCDELRFKLEPGVVINVFKSHVPPITCGAGGIIEPDYSPEAPDLPSQPSPPPPKGTPDENKIPLSSPYEGDDDNGNTYVRDVPTAPYTDPTSIGPNGGIATRNSTPQQCTGGVYTINIPPNATIQLVPSSEACGSFYSPPQPGQNLMLNGVYSGWALEWTIVPNT